MSRSVYAAFWAVFALLLGTAMGYRMHMNPAYCLNFPSFCRLPPAGYSFYALGVFSTVLMFGLADLVRSAVTGKRLSRLNNLVVACAGALLLLWLWAGLSSGVPKA